MARRASVRGQHAEIQSREIRHFLAYGGLGNLVRMIETRFPKVCYFAVSALGRSDDRSGDAFIPRGVIAPLIWLFYYTDALGDTDSFDRGFVNFHWYLYRALKGQELTAPLLVILGIGCAFALVASVLYFTLALVPFLLLMAFSIVAFLIYIGCLIALIINRLE